MKPIKLIKLKKARIKPVKVEVLQSVDSLQDTAEKHHLTLDLTEFMEDTREEETKKKELDQIKEEWEMIEAAKKEINDEKDKIVQVKAIIAEDRKTIDEEWECLHAEKSKFFNPVQILEEGEDSGAQENEEQSPEVKSSAPVRKKYRIILTGTRTDEILKKTEEEEKEADEPLHEVPRLRLIEISTLTEEVKFSSYYDKAIDLEKNFKENFLEKRSKEEKEKFQNEVFSYLGLIFNTNQIRISYVEDPKDVISSLGLKFCKEFEESHQRIHGSLAGISMTKEIKDKLFDRVLLFIEVKKTVDNHLRNHLAVGSHKCNVASKVFSHKILDQIIESKRIFDNDQTGRKLTEDNKLWISHCIKFYSNLNGF